MQGKKTEIRTDLHTAAELRALARGDAAPRKVKRLLAMANALDGMSFTAAARAAGMERQALGFSAYTLDDLCALAKDRFDVDYGPTGMSNVVKRLGFSRQKARPHHPKKDAAAQAAFKGAP